MKHSTINIAAGGVLLLLIYSHVLHIVYAIPYQFAVLEALSIVAPLAISTKISLAALGFFRPSDFKMATLLLIGFVLSVLVVVVQRFVVQPIYDEHLTKHFIQVGWKLHFIIAFIVNSAGLTLSLFWNELRDQTAYLSRREEAEQLNREAELLMLRHQLQPHFLFNSLNSINALIGNQPDKARSMIYQLGSFLRDTIKIDDQKPIYFEKELQQIELYLNIEKVRFGHRLEIDMQVDDSAPLCKVPPLLLQPLLENAIKFGLYGTSDAVKLQLTAKKEQHFLIIEVTNPYDEDSDSVEGTGFGLRSVQRRLYLTYGYNDLVQTKQKEHNFTVTVKIPQ